MKQTIASTITCITMSAAALGLSACQTNKPDEAQAKRPRYESTVLATSPYSSFLNNWDTNAYPMFYALLRSPSEYMRYHSPAATMGNTRPFAPPPEWFANDQLLVIAKVTPAPKDRDSNFVFKRALAQGDELAVYYDLLPLSQGASYTIKDGLNVTIPKSSLSKITIYENEQKVGELNLAAGQLTNMP